jgi:hypothetical protein
VLEKEVLCILGTFSLEPFFCQNILKIPLRGVIFFFLKSVIKGIKNIEFYADLANENLPL